MKNIMTCTFTETQGKDFAKKIYELLLKENIQIVYLEGEMGTGKTTFVQNIVHEIDPDCLVKSPTYNYMNEYIIGGKYIWHFDLYRINNNDEIIDFGLIDYLNRESGIAFIEWPERINTDMFNEYKSLKLNFLYEENKNERSCIISFKKNN